MTASDRFVSTLQLADDDTLSSFLQPAGEKGGGGAPQHNPLCPMARGSNDSLLRHHQIVPDSGRPSDTDLRIIVPLETDTVKKLAKRGGQRCICIARIQPHGKEGGGGKQTT